MEKFHHYCFACEVHVISDHKPLYAYTTTGYAYYANQAPSCLLWIGSHETTIKRTKINKRLKHKCKHYQYSSKPVGVYIHTSYIRSNSQRYTPERTRGIYNTRLAMQKRGCGIRHTKILVHQTWVGHNRWYGSKRQMNNNTISDVDADIESAVQQPHGN